MHQQPPPDSFLKDRRCETGSCPLMFVLCVVIAEAPSGHSVDETLLYNLQGGHGGAAVASGDYCATARSTGDM